MIRFGLKLQPNLEILATLPQPLPLLYNTEPEHHQ